jgi:hypothetical protein
MSGFTFMLVVNLIHSVLLPKTLLEMTTMAMRAENQKLPTDEILRAGDQRGNTPPPLFEMELLQKIPQPKVTASLPDLVITNGQLVEGGNSEPFYKRGGSQGNLIAESHDLINRAEPDKPVKSSESDVTHPDHNSHVSWKTHGHYTIAYWHHNGHDTVVGGRSDLPGEQDMDF